MSTVEPGVRFRIRHVTTYSFDRPIFLEPHTVRLTPRSDGSFHLASHRLSVMPTPAGASVGLDAWGNTVHRVDSESEGVALRANPFDYLVDAPVEELPPRYTPTELAALSACLAVDPSPAVERYADRIAGASPLAGVSASPSARPSTPEFLAALTAALAAEHTSVVRPEGPPFGPETTLDTREVSCRDLAVLFIAACRIRGIAARFVSGYQAGDPGQTNRDLHAWVEAYLPGAGWRAYDPTLGLVVANQHVAVAAAAHWEDAAPVTGNFRGTGAGSGLESTIELTCWNGVPTLPRRGDIITVEHVRRIIDEEEQ